MPDPHTYKNTKDRNGPVARRQENVPLVRIPSEMAEDDSPGVDVFLPIQSVEAKLTLDATSRSGTVTASIRFRAGSEVRRPALRLPAEIQSARLDGADLHLTGDILDSRLWNLGRMPAAGPVHTLQIDYHLRPFRPSEAAEQPRGLNWFWCPMLLSGHYLEIWFPSNMIRSEFDFAIELRLNGAETTHELFANGAVTKAGAHHWRVDWPAGGTRFAPAAVLVPAERPGAPGEGEQGTSGKAAAQDPRGAQASIRKEMSARLSLSAGDRLGPYEVVGVLGRGGMGTVYRARDPRMGRDVAVKVVPERFSEHFSREVRAISALNHPNICTVFDVGPNYLVMELLEGPTLAQRMKEGPMPVQEAVGIARQMASALHAAHDKGVIHRDPKPSNVKFTSEGVAKVLDFGLAKVGSTGPKAPLEEAQTSTLTLHTAQGGVIMGTAAYMAPEQVRTQAIDKRADIWSFGVVLYEMLSGQRLFEGETLSDVLAAVLRQEVDWRPIPWQARRLVRSCLQRDPRKRLQDIADAELLLEEDDLDGDKQRVSASFLLWRSAALIAGGVAAALFLLR